MKRSVALFVVLVFVAVGCGGGSSDDRVGSSGDRVGSSGDRITFNSDHHLSHPSEIFVMNADGTEVRRLTNNDDDWMDDRMPSWSPDGDRIVFESTRDGDSKIFMMNADGSLNNTYSTGQQGSCPSFGG